MECNGLRNRNIAIKGKVEREKPAKHEAVLIVRAAAVALKRTRISSDTDKHDAPTSSDEPDDTVPVNEYEPE